MIYIKPNMVSLNKRIISKFEKEVGLKITADYIKFILKYNGGIPEANILELKENSSISISVNTFFGIGVEPINDIIIQYEQLSSRIPSQCIPIARAEGGDIICLNLGLINYGKIYLWEHETEKDIYETVGIENLRFLASSFNSLLDDILPYEAEKLDMDEYEVEKVWIDPDFLKQLDLDKQ